MMDERWMYDNLESSLNLWPDRGPRPDDNIDFHLDLGCGRLKKGRIGMDRHDDPGVDIVQDMDADPILPFDDGMIHSIITSHFLEHIRDGFLTLMDECYRVIKPGGIMWIIVPLYPSHTAVADPDHKRFFAEGTFRAFTRAGDGKSWMESFSTPYTKALFVLPDTRGDWLNPDMTAPPENPFLIGTEADQREMRVTLIKPD